MTQDKMREAFEEWARERLKNNNNVSFDKTEKGNYFDYIVNSLWCGWQARVPVGYVVAPIEPTGPMIMYGIHAHERNDDLPNIGLGPKCIGIYRAMIAATQKEVE